MMIQAVLGNPYHPEYGVATIPFPIPHDQYAHCIRNDINMMQMSALDELLPLVKCAELLAQKYDVVVTNPPYMGASGMNARLSQYVKDHFPDTKADLFSCFIERGFQIANARGFVSMITMESWMFLSSFEKMRQNIVDTHTIVNMVHMPYLGKGGTSLGINFGTAAAIFNKRYCRDYNSQFDYEEKEEWYFSIVDVVAVLTDQPDQRGASNYWAKLKQRLKEEGADQLLTNCQQLKMRSPKDGKRYNTDVADTEQLLRIIQSIPSPKAEPFKLWLAQVGRERIEETIDPELTIDRALETYLKKGYSREWINQRLQAIQVRKELTDEWDARGVQKGVEYAILTDEISRAWSGMSTRQYKNLKGLKKENLRDNMTTLELVLNMLAEATTTEISKQKAPSTFSENMAVAREGGEAAGIARKAVEERTGVPVITPKNAAQLNQVVTDLLEGAVSDTKEKPKDK